MQKVLYSPFLSVCSCGPFHVMRLLLHSKELYYTVPPLTLPFGNPEASDQWPYLLDTLSYIVKDAHGNDPLRKRKHSCNVYIVHVVCCFSFLGKSQSGKLKQGNTCTQYKTISRQYFRNNFYPFLMAVGSVISAWFWMSPISLIRTDWILKIILLVAMCWLGILAVCFKSLAENSKFLSFSRWRNVKPKL